MPNIYEQSPETNWKKGTQNPVRTQDPMRTQHPRRAQDTKNVSTLKKLTTQSIHFWKNLQMVASNPCKIHEIFNQFLFKVSDFFLKKKI